MGRIEEALRRASGETGAAPSQSRAPEPASDARFVSAWDVGGQPPQDTVVVTPQAGTRGTRAAKPAVVGLRAGHSGGQPAPSVRLGSQLAMNWPQPFADEVAEKLVVMRGTDAEAVKQYRALARALRAAKSDRGAKTVMVTSAADGEGKTLTAVNLALTLSEIEKCRVLLIDADFRRARIHRLFQVSAGFGLKDWLCSSDNKIPCVELTERLSLLPAGRHDGGDVNLSSERMRELLAQASASFDWVVLDGPPVLPHSEKSLDGSMVDAALMVIHAGKTSSPAVSEAVDIVGRERLLGVVLNRSDRRASASVSETASDLDPSFSLPARAPQLD